VQNVQTVQTECPEERIPMTTPAWLPDLTEQLRRQAADLIATHDLPGAVIGLVAGPDPDRALAWSQGFGWGGGPSRPDPSDPTGRALDADTLFRVASITKTFTATALVQLRDEGTLHLDDPLVKHVPEFAAVGNPFGPIEDVTLRKVASHTSGLMGEPPTDHWTSLRFPTREEWLPTLPRVRVAIRPGSAFKYSNLGYTLLGEVIERCSGRAYVEYIRRSILEPLGMTSSSFEPSDELRTRAATGHLPHPYQDAAEAAPPSPLSGMASAGQLWTTARDLARWIVLHFGDVEAERGGAQILAGSSLAEMRQPCYVDPSWVAGYGVGWAILRHGERVYHGHGGSVPGFRSQILFSRQRRIGLIVLIDGVGPADQIALPLIDTVAGHVDAAEQARPSVPPTRAPEAYQRLLGMYRRYADTVTVEYRGNGLVLKGQRGSLFAPPPRPVLEPTAEPHAFMVRGGRLAGEELTFSVTDDGTVTAFTVGGFRFNHLLETGSQPGQGD
jgi:CubicO group peptidase (beta-lactamase class C family)